MEVSGRAVRKTPAAQTEAALVSAFMGAGGEDLSSAGGGTAYGTVGAGTASTTVLKALPGRLCAVLVTSAGTASTPVQFFDNTATASGNIIGVVQGSATITGIPFLF
jgi:hypothetical protein